MLWEESRRGGREGEMYSYIETDSSIEDTHEVKITRSDAPKDQKESTTIYQEKGGSGWNFSSRA